MVAGPLAAEPTFKGTVGAGAAIFGAPAAPASGIVGAGAGILGADGADGADGAEGASVAEGAGSLGALSALRVTRIVSCFRGTAEVTSGISGLCELGAFSACGDVFGVIAVGIGALGAEGAGFAPAGVDFRVTRTVSLRSGTDEVLRICCLCRGSVSSGCVLLLLLLFSLIL